MSFSIAHACPRALALILLFAAALPARASFLPGAGSTQHGWISLPADKEGRVTGLYHFPAMLDPGVARAGPRLASAPTHLAASEDRLLIVIDEVASPPLTPLTTSNKTGSFAQAPVQRRVQSIGVRPGVAPGYFEYRPLNRAPETLPSLPIWGRLEGVALASSAPIALLAPSTASPNPAPARPGDRALLVLHNQQWIELPLPDDLLPGVRTRLLADGPRLSIAQESAGDRLRVWSADSSELRGRPTQPPPPLTWTSEDLATPAEADLYMLAAGQVVAVDVDTPGEVRFWLLRTAGAHALESTRGVSGDRAIFPVGERLYTVWKPTGSDPRLQVGVISALTGAALYSGPVGADPIVSGRELHTLALMLGFVLLTIMIFALRPDAAQRQAASIPDGWSLAGPGVRSLAVLIDLVPGLVLGAVVFKVRPGDMLSAAMLSPDTLMSDVAAFLTAIGITILHSAGSEMLTGRTLGKWIMGLRVVSIDGKRPSLWQALARSALKFLCPPLALFVFLDVMSRHPADVLTGSAVIRRAPEPRPGTPPQDPPQPGGG